MSGLPPAVQSNPFAEGFTSPFPEVRSDALVTEAIDGMKSNGETEDVGNEREEKEHKGEGGEEKNEVAKKEKLEPQEKSGHEDLVRFDPQVREEGQILEQWLLQESATQLTFYGLINLHKSLNEGELAVFFRNNHFATIVKRQEQLYLLVTDEGYLHVDGVVWELLNEVAIVARSSSLTLFFKLS